MTDSAPLPTSTVFIIDDDQSIREALHLLFEPVGLSVRSFETAADFLAAYDNEAPACLLLDVRLPGVNGLDLQDELKSRGANVPIIMMSAYGDIPIAVQAMRAGAIDFIQKPFSAQTVIDRVQEALARSREWHRAAVERAEVAARLQKLTPRQRAVLDGLAAGKPSKIIAAEMGLSPKTVDVHRSRLMRRLDARSLAELFRKIGAVPNEPWHTPGGSRSGPR